MKKNGIKESERVSHILIISNDMQAAFDGAFAYYETRRDTGRCPLVICIGKIACVLAHICQELGIPMTNIVVSAKINDKVLMNFSGAALSKTFYGEKNYKNPFRKYSIANRNGDLEKKLFETNAKLKESRLIGYGDSFRGRTISRYDDYGGIGFRDLMAFLVKILKRGEPYWGCHNRIVT